MKANKYFSLFIVLALLATLTIGIQAQDDVVTIEYWQYFFEARQTAMNQLIEQFEAENPDIDVIHNSEIPYDNFRDEIAASAPAGVGPDVVTLFYGWIPAFVDAGYLIPLPEEDFPAEWIESYFSPMVAESKFLDEYWAIPTAVRSLALFYNIDMLEAAGYDAPPATLDEFLEMAQALTIYDGEPDILNIVQEGYVPEMTGQAHHWFREALLRQYGGQPFGEDNRTVEWNSEAGCQAFKYLSDFETDYMTGSNDLFDGGTQAFINGQAALHIDGSFRIGSIASGNPDLNYGVAELPAGADGSQHTFGSYWTHGITRQAEADEAKLEASVRFLKFITSVEAGILWVNEVGELPAQLEAASDPTLLEDPILGPFSAGLEYAHATFFVDETQQRQHLIDAYDQIRLGGMDPCDALNDAAELEQTLLDEFWAAHSE
ncbi:MAG: extracellular solute-binding protein [Chloroflexi bacterium]|nr:extracellular solute-binding protein [Chloroflexota bacterium]